MGGLIWFFWGGPSDKRVEGDLQKINDSVAADAEKQYFIAGSHAHMADSSDRINMCVQAGLVVAAYLQAKDEKNYAKWKAQETHDCKLAGLRR